MGRMARPLPLLLLLLLLLAGCAAPGPAAPPGEVVGSVGLLPAVLDPAGRPFLLGELLQDRIHSEVVGGRSAERIDRVDWLLLVVSKPGCEWTRRFLEEAEGILPDLRALHARTAAVLEGEEGEHGAAWDRIRASGIPVYRDRDGAAFRYYVQSGTPALALLDRWGTVVFALDGYLPPADLLAKMRAGDFAAVKAAGG